MQIVSAIAIYFILWWVVLFAVLPFGVKPLGAGAENTGHEPGAPVQPMLLRKVFATTLISAALFLFSWWLITSGIVSLDDLPFYNTMPKP